MPSESFYIGVLTLLFPLSVLILLATLVLHLTLPKPLRERYLDDPYFNLVERALTFPWNILCTLAFVRAIAFPRSMVKRFGQSDLRVLTPRPFMRACQVYILLLGLSAILITVMVMGYIQFVIQGRIEFP